ncbi:DEAD/DEAH box helicase [Thermodesulforhabdus norvegica]|uniref:Superfamily II RNA helicase n=1 Tax=Thermodesulforhabdus norvegica TaxID=39841 RepID=A0A1I4R233_9BACT|nr:DEAD/DEAH box helicase [Thermodesulforhabdus norvegica]SFM46036.1 Superfamily II RNA helicase [Thermodesulforhabdus norvegica]
MRKSRTITARSGFDDEFCIRIHPRVKNQLACIRCPEVAEFKPDPFQVEAIEAIKEADVLVTAPTGAGKTYIAVEAIRDVFDRGGKAWYASPLKALSNAKYEEFGCLFGAENVGILTGDRKENPEAPVIVGTTEILRNQLYDTMHRGDDLDVDLVVLDEAHYLGDEDRGVVWEEVLIYLPPRVRVLLLSATIRNAAEICDWLTWLRGNECRWVNATERPVPLYPLFLFPSGELVPLETPKGFFKKIDTVRPGDFPRFYFPDIPRIMEVLRTANLLPAIFFLKSRADCERAIEMCPPVDHTSLNKSREEFLQRIEELLEIYPFLRNHRHLEILKRSRVGAHHGGQLPYWKVFLEKLMQEGYLEAIFSTSTVAAGVNFPARTVVITQDDRYNGHEFVPLTATELLQMTGRAGRRGMDEVGFVLVVPGPYQDARNIYELLKSPPDPIVSQVRVNFSMVLNLLLSHRPEEIRELFSLSLATFQSMAEERKRKKQITGRLKKEIGRWQKDMACGSFDRLTEIRTRYINLSRRISELKRTWKKSFLPASVEHLLLRGRVVYNRRGVPYVVFERPLPGSDRIKAVRLTIPLKTRKGRVKISEIKISRLASIGGHIPHLPEPADLTSWRNVVESFERSGNFGEHKIKPFPGGPAEEMKELLAHRSELPCERCELYGPCIKETNHPFTGLIYRYERVMENLTSTQDKLWNSFMYHYRFLQREGYVDDEGRLTDDGLWASKLRIDQPLLISECIRRGVFPENDPALLAALIAPFVMDRDRTQDIEMASLVYRYPDLAEPYFRMIQSLQGLRNRLHEWGFMNPPIPFWTVPALYYWARGSSWQHVKEIARVDEGDLVMLIIRTADHLHQIESLVDTHPDLARTAREARTRIMREPVIVV